MSKIILVTGGSRGIGRATALQAAAKGYAVCVNYKHNKQAAIEVVKAIEDEGGKAIAVAADISREKEVATMYKMISEKLGPVSALVNNAGVVDKQSAVEDISAERLQKIFSINVFGTFLCSREAIKIMSTKHGGNGGSIVNVSSKAAAHGAPFDYVDYAASKAAVDTFTLGLSKEVAADGIRVNAVRPGIIYTEIHASGGEPGRVDRMAPLIPMKRGGQPEEVANTIMWLLSDEASYITGALVDVTGEDRTTILTTISA